MSINFASLSSGSNGNCYYAGSQSDAILVDAGISCRETQKRISRLGLSFDNIRAIFISHEHTDHIKSAAVIARKFQIPVFISPETNNKSRIIFDDHLTSDLKNGMEVQFGDIVVKAFSKHHDAIDPLSFTITDGNLTVGVMTDIGSVSDDLVHHFSKCDAAFLESNYDELMLDKGRYPLFLKNRIRGGNGHLSNNQALELFKTHKSQSMSHLILSHLSKDNNNPELVLDLFNKHSNGTEISIAPRYKESALFFIESLNGN